MAAKKSSGNVFLDIGFDQIESQELAVKSDLITLLAHYIRVRKLTQAEAAILCGTDQPTLSKVLSGLVCSAKNGGEKEQWQRIP